MAAATAQFKANLLIAAAGSPPPGLEIIQPALSMAYSVTVNERRGFSFLLALTGNNQVLAFGGITAGTLLTVSASAAVQITMVIPGAGATLFASFFATALPTSTGPITACTITALSNATSVDVILGG